MKSISLAIAGFRSGGKTLNITVLRHLPKAGTPDGAVDHQHAI